MRLDYLPRIFLPSSWYSPHKHLGKGFLQEHRYRARLPTLPGGDRATRTWNAFNGADGAFGSSGTPARGETNLGALPINPDMSIGVYFRTT